MITDFRQLGSSLKVFNNLAKDLDKCATAINNVAKATTNYYNAQNKSIQLTEREVLSEQKKLQAIQKTEQVKNTTIAKQLIDEEKINQTLTRSATIQDRKTQSLLKAEQEVWKTIKAENQAEISEKRLQLQTARTAAGLDKLSQSTQKLGLSMNIAIGNLTSNLIMAAQRTMTDFVGNVSKAGVQLDALRNTFAAGARGWKQGGEEMQFVADVANKLGLNLEATYEPYAKFMTSFTRSGGTIAQSRQIFEDLSTAMVSLHLPAERMEGVFVALEQMANKGTVQAEELKRQLANALPGAFELAAESMGILPAELMDLMKKGKVVSKDFLPKFAETVKDALGGQIGIAVDQYNAHLNRLKSQTFLLQANLGQMFNNAIMPLVIGLGKLVTGLSKLSSGLGNSAIAVTAFQTIMVGLGVAAVRFIFQMQSLAGVSAILGTSISILSKNFMTFVTSLTAAQVGATLAKAAFIGLGVAVVALINKYNVVSQQFSETAIAQRDVANTVTGLVSEYTQLAEIMDRSEAQQQAYNRTLENLKADYPEVLKYIQDNNISIKNLTESQAEYIAKMSVAAQVEQAAKLKAKELGDEWLIIGTKLKQLGQIVVAVLQVLLVSQ